MPKYWKFSPGEGAKYWTQMFQGRFASIGWGDYDYVNKNQSDISSLNPGLPDKHARIISIINQIDVNDLLIAFKGKTEVIGIGKVTKVAQYSAQSKIIGSDHYNFVDVEWEELKPHIKLEKNVSPDTLNEISSREDILTKLESVIKRDKANTNTGKQVMKLPLNQILYGPPGTGKTFNTINKALEIIFQDKLQIEDYENGKVKESVLINKAKEDLGETNCKDLDNRKILKKCFDKHKEAGAIVFTTFHQSYGYEEFVEGIKPCGLNEGCNDNNAEIKYTVQDGVFTKLCQEAQKKTIVSDNLKINLDKIWKVSLGGSGDNVIKKDCYENSRIRFGYKEDFPKSLENYDKLNNPLNGLYNRMTIGDIVVSLNSNKSINQIGIVSGEYEYLEKEDDYKHSRTVKWLFKKPEIVDFFEINNNSVFSNPAIHEINPNREKLLALIPTNRVEKNNADKNYILIIDEINRGNISKIFGELITLIEESKRIGSGEALEVTLPYSGESFGVPSNLYIIGTMNTADRSIAPIDTALRRRFVFEEMSANPELLTVEKTPSIYTEVNLKLLLEAINARIEYLYDRDHTIGHAYLIDVKTLEDLKFAFKNKIIPLLAEYFYEDWENIDHVLNNNGFIKSNESSTYLSKIKSKVNGKKVYMIQKCEAWTPDMFKKIYDDNALDNSQVQPTSETNDAMQE